MKIVVVLLMVCCLAFGQAKEPTDKEVETYTLVDEIIRGILNNLREKISALKISDIDNKFVSDNFNVSLIAKEITHRNIENFKISNLHSTLIPLQITNLTLTWKNIEGSALYDFVIDADLEKQNPLRIFGKGLANLSLNNLFFTIGAKLEQKNGAFQIKKDGLFGFDVLLQSSTIKLESLGGSEEIGQVVGQLLGDMLPSIINEFKHSAFNFVKNDLIETLNEILRKKKDALNDDSYESEEFENLL